MPRASTIFVWSCLLVGCEGSLGGVPGAADAGPSREPLDAGAGDPLSGLDRTPDPRCTGRWVAGIVGRVVDERGAPVPDARAQACIALAGSERRACLSPGRSDADGRFAIEVPVEARCAIDVVMRVVVPGAARSTAYCGVPLVPREAVLSIDPPFVLFATAAPLARTATRVAWGDGVTLELGADGVDGEALASLTARVVGGAELARACPDAAPGGAVDLAVAFAPEAPVDGEGARLRLDGAGAAPGVRYEVLVLGGLGTLLRDGTVVDEGAWGLVGHATADASGAIVVGPDAAIPHLSTIGLRRVP